MLGHLPYYGDVVVPTPAWVSYAPQAEILGRHISWMHTRRANNWKLLPDELNGAFREDGGRPRIIVLNYPSSPTGGTYEADELAALARVARKYGLIVLFDEIYGDLHHQDGHVSIARFYPEGTIIGGGLSKWCGAGGWRSPQPNRVPAVQLLNDQFLRNYCGGVVTATELLCCWLQA